MRRLLPFLFLSFLLSISSFAQIIDKNKSKKSIPSVNKPNGIQTVGDKISFKDGSTILLEINSESSGSSVSFPSVGSMLSGTKLYNNGGNLYWGSSQLNTLSGAAEINDLSDAIYDGSSLFLGNGSGTNDDGSSNVNTAVGISALYSNISGEYNTANGFHSLYHSTGDENTAVGHASMFANTTGKDNTAVGYLALSGNTSASYNTAVGSSALFGNTTGFSNTAVGNKTLYKNTAGYGNTAGGSSALYENTTGQYNTAFGEESLNGNTEGSENTAIGYLALGANIKGNQGVAVGVESQRNIITSSTNESINYNTSVGYQSLMGSSFGQENTGNYNSAFGYQTLISNTSGDDNTAEGFFALNKNTTGYGNTANGSSALQSNTEGYQNTTIGYASLSGNTTGDYNVAVGVHSLEFNKTGSKNTALGYHADVLSDNLENATAIGYNAKVNSNNTIQLGDNNIQYIYAKVGITTTSDSTKKENFLKADGNSVLEKFRNFKLRSWNFKGDNPENQRHYGIMAQDFFSAFGHDGMGTIGNDTTVSNTDEIGINMIAIQALEKRTRKQEEWIKELIKQNSELRIRNSEVSSKNLELEERLSKIESLLDGEKFTQINKKSVEKSEK